MNSPMKRAFTFAALCFFASAYSQNPYWCPSDKMHQEKIAKYAGMEVVYDDLDSFVHNHDEENGDNERGTVKIIPTVVHIIHNYGPENVSDAVVADAIRFLNEDFMGTSADLSGVVPAFTGVVGNPQFEFRLATLDPNGNCTNGITRAVSGLTYDAGDDSKLDYWPRNKYYNIWVVFNIYTEPGSNGVIAGYSVFPSFWGTAAHDGTILGYNYFGTAGSNFAKRVLSHETGHWFALPHTFGNVEAGGGDCSGSDGIGDTPVTDGSFSTCVLTKNNCSGILANVQNIMDYSSCTNMFTDGQSAEMIDAANSSTAGRSNLSTNGNLIATGTATIIAANCAPVVDFHANRYSFCAGTSATFYDNSWNANVTSRLWTFTDGVNVITDTSEIPTITFNTPGVYDVTLTATSPGGNDSETRTNYIYVYDVVADIPTAPFVEDFENDPINSGLWSILYNMDPIDGWRTTNSASVSPNTSMMVHNYALGMGQVHSLISPSYDFTTTGGPISFTFKYAFAEKNADNTDELKVYGSSNCGQTWQLRGTYSGATLLTGGIKTTDWYPNSGQWATKTITSMSSYVGRPNVRFKFEFTSGGGNNLFIEDINITGPIGIEEATNTDLQMNVYPNPVQNEINIDFVVDQSYSATFRLINIAGQQIATLGVRELVAGENHVVYTVPTGTSKGLYFLQMEAGNKVFTHKIIID